MYSFDPKTIGILKKGGIGVVPTDTLYGIVGSAFSKRAVERIYKVKGRDDHKPFIVLITDLKELEKFVGPLTRLRLDFPLGKGEGKIQQFLIPKVTVILPLQKKVLKKFSYLHRGENSLAFRMIGPRNKNVYTLLRGAGPLVAPSANPQGAEPAKTVWEAKRYFQDQMDFYVCGGTRKGEPSTIISFTGKKPKIVRQGNVKLTLTNSLK
jgi:L-threonylcarbamoyladenylate synthase